MRPGFGGASTLTYTGTGFTAKDGGLFSNYGSTVPLQLGGAGSLPAGIKPSTFHERHRQLCWAGATAAACVQLRRRVHLRCCPGHAASLCLLHFMRSALRWPAGIPMYFSSWLYSSTTVLQHGHEHVLYSSGKLSALWAPLSCSAAGPLSSICRLNWPITAVSPTGTCARLLPCCSPSCIVHLWRHTHRIH